MSAYFIVDLDVHDPETFAVYRDGVGAFVAKHGGEYLARGGETEVFEGDFVPHRLIVFRFPSRDAIRAFLADPDYLPLKELRFRSATTRAFAVEALS
jgi:uncharacterized protein (DUF1330 family)